MIRATVLLLLGLPVAAPSAPGPTELTMPQFRDLKPFQGRITKVEQIPHQAGYPLHSTSGPDFRVTIIRPDGTTLVVRRIHTHTGSVERLKALVDKKECALPKSVVECEDRIGAGRLKLLK